MVVLWCETSGDLNGECVLDPYAHSHTHALLLLYLASVTTALVLMEARHSERHSKSTAPSQALSGCTVVTVVCAIVIHVMCFGCTV